MNGWSMIQTFTNPQDAYMARAYLESEAVETMIQDELTAQVNNFYSNAIGGVKLWVKEEDRERGIEILKDGGYIIPEKEKEEADWVWVRKETDVSHCPFCHSDNIIKLKDLNLVSVVLYFILGVLFPLFRSTWKCCDCGKAWKYKR
ncbi:MAG: DUF2007 domain-containing protein [Odoribacter sp.]